MRQDVNVARLVDNSREEAVCLLKRLIAFDSQVIEQGRQGREGLIQEYMAGELKAIGAETDIFEPDNNRLEKYPDFNMGHEYNGRPCVVGVLKGSGGGRSLILNGHADTVSPGDVSLWKHDPYSGTVIGNEITGLGAVDMKGGLAAMLMAVKIAKAMKLQQKGDIIFQSVVDEEGGGNGTLACVDRGYKADAALIAEPTGLEIACAHRGAMHLRISTRGISTHASMKDRGVNAIEKMVELMKALASLEREWSDTKKHPLLPSPTISFCRLDGGNGASIIPAECEAKVNIKYLPTERTEVVKAEIEERISAIAGVDAWLRDNPPELKWLLNTSPYEASTAHPLVEIMKCAVEAVAGRAVITGLPSGADARILNNIGGIPTFICGPGELAQAHHIDEMLPIDEYLRAVEVYVRVIMNWVG
ncbi:MAG: ArgE/DapE family deacylase [bacterium]|nr:ArgE/DapE family deacylase [bacterium]